MNKERYTLRVSVRLLGGVQITDMPASTTWVIENVRVSVEQDGHYLILTAADFDSEAEAEQFLPRMQRGLWNLAIGHGVAFAPFTRRDIVRVQDPEAAARNLAKMWGHSDLAPVHGSADEEGWTVFQSDENIRFTKFGSPQLHSAKPWAPLASSLASAMAQSAPTTEINRDLTTALDLYLASFQHSSLGARFLTLTTVLEILAPVTKKHPKAVQLIDELHAQIRRLLSDEPDEDARDSMDQLQNETSFRKERSIKKRIRSLILEKLPLADRERKQLELTLSEAYDLRSALVHRGRIDPAQLASAHDATLHAVRLLLSLRLGLPINESECPMPDASV